jgi:hypothetical protein
MNVSTSEISTKFLTQLNEIEASNSNITDCANKAIKLSRATLYKLKSQLLQSKFESIENEIDFFNNIKQVSATPLIYYSEVRSFELQFPMANASTQKKYINKKIAKLNRFFIHNIDFIQYIELGHSHFDSQYFTRRFSDSYHIVSSKFYFQDPDFTTARDMLLGKVKAYSRFINYLQQRLNATGYKTSNEEISKSIPKLQWTSSKAALTELVYALYSSRVINNGDVDIKEIALTLQQLFKFDLKDVYKIYAEIKSRKNSRTKFLDTLSTRLISFMDESEK